MQAQKATEVQFWKDKALEYETQKNEQVSLRAEMVQTNAQLKTEVESLKAQVVTLEMQEGSAETELNV